MENHVRVGARSIIIENDSILLVEFDNGKYYNIPGGGAQPNETMKETAKREVYEETGLDVEIRELLYTLEYAPHKCNAAHGNRHHLGVVFRGYIKGNLKPKKPSIPDFCDRTGAKQTACKWIKIDDLEKINLVPRINSNIIEYHKTGKFEPSFFDTHI